MNLAGADSRTSAAAGLPLFHPERSFRTHQMNRRVRGASGDGQGAALKPCLEWANLSRAQPGAAQAAGAIRPGPRAAVSWTRSPLIVSSLVHATSAAVLGTRRWGFSLSGATVVADGSHRLLLAQPGAGAERLVEAVRLERLADLGDHLDLACE